MNIDFQLLGVVSHLLWILLLLALVVWVYAGTSRVFHIRYRWLLVSSLLLTATWFFLLAVSTRKFLLVSRESLAVLLRVVEFFSVTLTWVWVLLQLRTRRLKMLNESNTTVYVKEGSRILSGLPSVVWLLVALGGTVAMMHYFPFTQAILGIVATILLFAIGKWFGLSRDEIVALTSAPTIQMPEGSVGAPAPEESKLLTTKSKIGRVLL